MRIGVLTGGGDCPGLNAVIRAIVRKATLDEDTEVFGFYDAWDGVMEQRGVVLDSIKYLDFVHLSSIPTAEVIQLLKPRFYLKGNDWLTRGGVPEVEESLCRNLGIEILYLETVTNSSSKLLQNWTVALES